MQKILLALQYWDGDKRDAWEVARLVADLQSSRSLEADFLFMPRFDSTLPDSDLTQHVSKKFNVFRAVAKRRGAGWPFGTTQLWLSVLDWIYTNRRAEKIPQYKAVFTFEPDACPLTPDWISAVSSGWDRAGVVSVYGAHLMEPQEHINGNALYSCDPEFLQWVTRKHRGVPPRAAWDVFLAAEFRKRGAIDSPEIKSWWNCKSFSVEQGEELVKRGVHFLHGVKTDQARQFVREKYGLPGSPLPLSYCVQPSVRPSFL